MDVNRIIKEKEMRGRMPVVAGKFYPGHKQALKEEVESYLKSGAEWAKTRPAPEHVWAVMLPHAGHIYCGRIIGETLAGITLPRKLIILCPNHTGYGRPLGVWPEGAWLTPLGEVQVDSGLAAELIATGCGYEPDTGSHIGEHSIEVLLPFLQEKLRNPEIVPVCVGARNPAILENAGKGLATVLRANPDAGVVVSSDMNHYESHAVTLAKDELALKSALRCDALELLKITEAKNISMCGAGPLAIALFAARDLGYGRVELVDHDTSGPISGDMEHTVGYAGLRLLKESA